MENLFHNKGFPPFFLLYNYSEQRDLRGIRSPYDVNTRLGENDYYHLFSLNGYIYHRQKSWELISWCGLRLFT